MRMFYTLIVVTCLACCYDATIFATNKQTLPHKYGQIGPILFYKQYIVFIIELGFSIYSESLLWLADIISRGLAYVRWDMLQVYWEGDKVACLH